MFVSQDKCWHDLECRRGEVRSDRVMESEAVKGEYFVAYQSTE